MVVLATHILALMVCFALACADDNDSVPDYTPITDTWAGTSIEVRVVDRPSDACPATFPFLDQHYGAVAQDLGLSTANATLPTLWWVSTEFLESVGCPGWVGGCVSYGQVHTRLLPNEHEVAHLVTQQFGGCHIILNEGLAEIYQAPDLAEPNTGTMAELLAEASGSRLPFEYYALAGSFTDFLLREYGVAAILDVCRLAPLGTDHVQLDGAVREVLGASLDTLIDDYDQTAARQPEEYLRIPVTCSSGDFVQLSNSTTLHLDVDFGCGNGVLGSETSSRRYQRRLDILDAAEYTFTFYSTAADDASWVRVIACEPGGSRYSYWTTPMWNGDKGYLTLDPGSYALTISRNSTVAVSVDAEPSF